MTIKQIFRTQSARHRTSCKSITTPADRRRILSS